VAPAAWGHFGRPVRCVDRLFLLVVIAMGGHYPSAVEDVLQNPEKYVSNGRTELIVIFKEKER